MQQGERLLESLDPLRILLGQSQSKLWTERVVVKARVFLDFFIREDLIDKIQVLVFSIDHHFIVRVVVPSDLAGPTVKVDLLLFLHLLFRIHQVVQIYQAIFLLLLLTKESLLLACVLLLELPSGSLDDTIDRAL
mmetsp:Transcript_23067/g.22467  ORF Transcript_23067/g.22467 Transcript_23067/m.22467 type:complete len:135 (-) Transcript_23067:1775-2179(-)